jgi:hypothetical protein
MMVTDEFTGRDQRDEQSGHQEQELEQGSIIAHAKDAVILLKSTGIGC